MCLDRLRQLRPCGEEAEGARSVNRQGGEAVAQVLDQGVAARYRVRAGEPLEAPHWPQPLLEVPMIALQSIVEVFGSPMLGDGQNQTQRWRVAPRLVRDDPRGGDASRVDGPFEEDLRGRSSASLAAIGIHD